MVDTSVNGPPIAGVPVLIALPTMADPDVNVRGAGLVKSKTPTTARPPAATSARTRISSLDLSFIVELSRAVDAALLPVRRKRVTLTFFQLKSSLLRCPKCLQIRDHRTNLLRRQHATKGGHGQFFGLIEGVPPTLVHHFIQLGIGMPPRVPSALCGGAGSSPCASRSCQFGAPSALAP